MATEETKRDVMNLTNLDMTSIKSISEAFRESGLFPDLVKEGTTALQEEAKAIVKVVAGQELGLPPVYSMQNFYIIKGRISMAAETMGLLLKRTGKYNYRVTEHTDQVCKIQFHENGEEIYLSVFTIADAKRAGLVKPDSGWMKYPKAMLFSRAMSQGSRIVAPELMGSAHTIEEIESINPDALKELEAPQPNLQKQAKKTKKGKSAEEAAPAGIETKPDESKDTALVAVVPETAENPSTAPSQTIVEFKRDPNSVVDIAGVYKALWEDYSLQPNQVMKELGISANHEITDTPPNCYIKVATIYGARGG